MAASVEQGTSLQVRCSVQRSIRISLFGEGNFLRGQFLRVREKQYFTKSLLVRRVRGIQYESTKRYSARAGVAHGPPSGCFWKK
jgi:hypothetical protein